MNQSKVLCAASEAIWKAAAPLSTSPHSRVGVCTSSFDATLCSLVKDHDNESDDMHAVIAAATAAATAAAEAVNNKRPRLA